MQPPRLTIRQDIIEWVQRHVPSAPPHFETRIPLDFIVAHSAAAHSLPIGILISRDRSERISLVRQITMYLCRRMTQSSCRDIALICGRTDHSTVLHAERRIENLIAVDALFGTWIHDLGITIAASYATYRDEMLERRRTTHQQASSAA
jgi:chromosomal replication initiation ATPase DnaA